MYEEFVVSTESVLLTKHDRIDVVGVTVGVGFKSGYDTERLVWLCCRSACGRNSDLVGS